MISIKALVKGNIGALRVCSELAAGEDAAAYLEWLAEVGLAGPDIWVAFKDVCGEDLDRLKAALRESAESRADLARRVRVAQEGPF